MVTIRFMVMEGTVEAEVQAILEARLGARAKIRREGDGPDLLLQRGRETLGVEVKSLGTLRHPDLLGRLATSILELRRMNAKLVPLAIVYTPQPTPAAVSVAREFMQTHAPEIGWGLVGRRGELVLEIPRWKISIHELPKRGSGPSVRSDRSLFSDLHSWLLKILLLREVKKPLWCGPVERVMSAEDLMRVGNVSRVTAYRFLRTFLEADFVRTIQDEIRIVRRADLLRAWFAWQHHHRVRELPVRWLLGAAPDFAVLGSKAPRIEYATAGFAACKLLGVLHATFTIPEIHVADLDGACRAWDLEPCDRRDAHFILLRTGYEASIFRATGVTKGVRVVDALQAALDVRRHAARGHEQSSYILHDVLRWEDL